ncbi:MAG: phage tail assembly chaperone, partial [Rhizobiales bacterium]|nr:phage tail assembly chaperone [Hyphomicrobiales bacterium]
GPSEAGRSGWDWPGSLKIWVSLGFDPDQFWRKTPREIRLILDARSAASEREHNERAWLAWHIAALSRAKVMPKIDKLMAKPKPTLQTWEQQLAIVRQLNAAFGGSVVRRQ